jgi:hypothetical protein
VPADFPASLIRSMIVQPSGSQSGRLNSDETDSESSSAFGFLHFLDSVAAAGTSSFCLGLLLFLPLFVLSVSLTGTDGIGYAALVLGGAKEIGVGFNTLGIYEEEFGCEEVVINLSNSIEN